MKRITLIFFSLVLTSSLLFSADRVSERLDEYFTKLDDSGQVVGSVSIAVNGDIISKKYFGGDDLENKLIPIGSVTKHFTAIIAYKLAAQNKLDLNSNISKYDLGVKAENDVKIIDLINHSSGYSDYVSNKYGMYWLKDSVSDEMIYDAVIKDFDNNKFHSFSYSNSGFYLLTKMLEEVTGNQYAELVEKYISKPLNLDNIYPYPYSENRILKSYSRNIDSWDETVEFHGYNIKGVGDILAGTDDLASYIYELFNNSYFYDINLDDIKTSTKNFYKGFYFGTGIAKGEYDGLEFYGHPGKTYGSSTYMFYEPNSKTSIAIGLNSNVYPVNQMFIEVLDIIFFNKSVEPSNYLVDFSEGIDNPIVGIYRSDKISMAMSVYEENGALMAKAEGQNPFPLTLIEENKYEFKMGGIKLEFDPTNELFTLFQGNITAVFKK